MAGSDPSREPDPTPGQLLTRQVRQEALALGFLACGITTPDPTPHGGFLDQWLARGYAGTMRYLHRQAAKRKDPRLIAPEARSVVVVLDDYGAGAPALPASGLKVARYARGRDYHLSLRERLERLATKLRTAGAALARCYADAGPVPERELAQRAGLGWIGKNTMLLRPGAGSFFFIGSVFTDLRLEPDAPFPADHCGTCTMCLDACPTGALPAPRLLDATRCISYVTIEHRGPTPPEIVPLLDGWAFGCDICNEVCPWNTRFAEQAGHPDYAPRPDLGQAGPGYFDAIDEDEFAARFGDTPLQRPGLDGMRRNWSAALASLGRKGTS